MTLLTRREAAERMRVSLPTLDRLTSRDGFPVVRIGRSVKIPDSLLEKWLEDNVGKAVELQ